MKNGTHIPVIPFGGVIDHGGDTVRAHLLCGHTVALMCSRVLNTTPVRTHVAGKKCTRYDPLAGKQKAAHTATTKRHCRKVCLPRNTLSVPTYPYNEVNYGQ